MRIEDIRKIVVVGAGSMGQEIALQCATCGFDVVMYDVSADALSAAKSQQSEILAGFVESGEMSPQGAADAASRILTTIEPEAAAHEADLLSESVPERPKVKRDVLQMFGRLCPERTIFTTNSSFILPSQIAKATERPGRFAGLHFHKHVWVANVVDVMPHRETTPETVQLLVDFSRRIGQIPIVVRTENYGYVFNALFEPLMFSALKLAANDVASVEDIDRAWMGVTKSSTGLFGLIDKIGLEVPRDIEIYLNLIDRDPQRKRCADYLQQFIDAGRLGVKTGQGFYRYPNPAYEQPDFLTGGAGGGERVAQQAGPAAQAPADAAATSAPMDLQPRVMQRFVLQAVRAPLEGDVPRTPRVSGAAWVLGRNSAASALCQRLRSLSVPVAEMPRDLSAEETMRWMDELWASCPAPHLFLLTARDNDAGTSVAPDRWKARYERGVLLPFFVCQRWFDLVTRSQLMGQATLVAATSLGGDFGISGRVAAAEGGGITGLLKAIGMEGAAAGIEGPRVRIVDLPGDESPDFVADALCTEFAIAQDSPAAVTRAQVLAAGADAEVGYVGRTRHVLRLARAPLGVAGQQELDRRGPWVVTGGGRGITGYLATELGRRFGLKLHLLGTTRLGRENYAELSPEELDRLKADVMKQAYRAKEKPNVAWGRVAKVIELQTTLRNMAQAGVRAEYHTCDVSEREQLAATLECIRGRDGPIGGILHGAGVEVTRRFDRKERNVVEATLGPKLNGAAALMELTRADPLRYFVAFGSLSGRFGSASQEDYTMANDMMCKLLQWFRTQRPECRSVAIHWPGWSAIGMAARPESRANLERIDHSLLAPPEGAGHLIDELLAGGSAGEVVIVDPTELPLAYLTTDRA